MDGSNAIIEEKLPSIGWIPLPSGVSVVLPNTVVQLHSKKKKVGVQLVGTREDGASFI